MLYKALKNHNIHLEPKATAELDATNGLILVPSPESKIYVHWLNDNGQLRNTFTMTFDTQVTGKIRLINGLNKSSTVHVIQIS
jgi:hypothetical protein